MSLVMFDLSLEVANSSSGGSHDEITKRLLLVRSKDFAPKRVDLLFELVVLRITLDQKLAKLVRVGAVVLSHVRVSLLYVKDGFGEGC